MEATFSQRNQSNKASKFLSAFGRGSDTSNTPEEHTDYLRYGILDLIYILSFRIRRRSRRECLRDYLKIVRLVLERSTSSATSLHAKATDIWNRICEVGADDSLTYGDEEDREAIRAWTRDHDDTTEDPEESSMYETPSLAMTLTV
jgi:hypothetical protein